MSTLIPAASLPIRPKKDSVLRLPNPMIAVVWLAIFVPGHMAEWWVERAFAAGVFLLGAFTLFSQPASANPRKALRQAAAFLFFIQFLFVFSLIHAVAFMGIETGMRDYFEVGRYLIIWMFVVYVARHYDDRVRRATEVATATALYYSLLVAFCYLRPVPYLTPFLRDTLYAHTKTYINYLGQLRLAAPFENPNFLGFFAMQVLTYQIFFSRSSMRRAHCLAALLVVYFSGSRTAWVATALVLGAAFAAFAVHGVRRMKLRVAVQLGLALFLFVAAGVRFSGAIMGNYRVILVLNAIRNGGIQKEENASARLEQNAQAVEYIKQSPILGWGPSKYATWDYLDNQYLYWGLRNGLLGSFVIMIGLLLVARRLILSQSGDWMGTVGVWTLVGAISVALLTCEFLNNFRLFFLTWFLGTAIARRPR